MEETSGIGFKEAAAIARQFVIDLYSEDEPLQNVLLEEIEHDRVVDRWLVTIGFDRRFTPSPSLITGGLAAASARFPQYRRALKRVEIDGETGNVLRMVEREIEQ